MCGIVGVFNLNGKPFSYYYLKKMADSIKHRGPDEEGYFVRENIALGHKRLSIIDTSPRSNQPMISKNGRWVLVFNGCIYNFLELKNELMFYNNF